MYGGSQVGRDREATRFRRGRNLAAWGGDMALVDGQILTLRPEWSGSVLALFLTLQPVH